eukprot:scaffold97465_cov19-Tisochrysis_lutea.AAC.1
MAKHSGGTVHQSQAHEETHSPSTAAQSVSVKSTAEGAASNLRARTCALALPCMQPSANTCAYAQIQGQPRARTCAHTCASIRARERAPAHQ